MRIISKEYQNDESRALASAVTREIYDLNQSEEAHKLLAGEGQFYSEALKKHVLDLIVDTYGKESKDGETVDNTLVSGLRADVQAMNRATLMRVFPSGVQNDILRTIASGVVNSVRIRVGGATTEDSRYVARSNEIIISDTLLSNDADKFREAVVGQYAVALANRVFAQKGHGCKVAQSVALMLERDMLHGSTEDGKSLYEPHLDVNEQTTAIAMQRYRSIADKSEMSFSREFWRRCATGIPSKTANYVLGEKAFEANQKLLNAPEIFSMIKEGLEPGESPERMNMLCAALDVAEKAPEVESFHDKAAVALCSNGGATRMLSAPLDTSVPLNKMAMFLQNYNLHLNDKHNKEPHRVTVNKAGRKLVPPQGRQI